MAGNFQTVYQHYKDYFAISFVKIGYPVVVKLLNECLK